jgi:hypothetical protein
MSRSRSQKKVRGVYSESIHPDNVKPSYVFEYVIRVEALHSRAQ